LKLNVFNNNGSLYIEGESFNFDEDIKNLYIFLENEISLFFHDIYNDNIVNKKLTRSEYVDIINTMFQKNDIQFIFLVANDEIIYYIDVSNIDLLYIFSEEIADSVFG